MFVQHDWQIYKYQIYIAYTYDLRIWNQPAWLTTRLTFQTMKWQIGKQSILIKNANADGMTFFPSWCNFNIIVSLHDSNDWELEVGYGTQNDQKSWLKTKSKSVTVMILIKASVGFILIFWI